MRYSLRDPELLRRIMETPGRGKPYTVRTLAQATGVSRSQVGRLAAGDRNSLDVIEAHALAEALGVAVLVLFAPPASPKQGQNDIGTVPT